MKLSLPKGSVWVDLNPPVKQKTPEEYDAELIADAKELLGIDITGWVTRNRAETNALEAVERRLEQDRKELVELLEAEGFGNGSAHS